jgi:hypothetical protein
MQNISLCIGFKHTIFQAILYVSNKDKLSLFSLVASSFSSFFEISRLKKRTKVAVAT